MAKVLTPARRARLEKLAAYLEGLPRNYPHFQMQEFIAGDRDGNKTLHYIEHNGGVQTCGTAACAVGHGPAAGIFAPPSLIAEFRNSIHRFDRADVWAKYARLMFVGDGPGDPLFEWCFGGSWAFCDNGHRGASARIRYLLEHGKPPLGFRFARPLHRALYAPYRIDAKAPAHA